MKAKDAGKGAIVASKTIRTPQHGMTLDQLEEYVRGKAQDSKAAAEVKPRAEDLARDAARLEEAAQAIASLGAAQNEIARLCGALAGIAVAVRTVIDSKQCPSKMKPGLRAIVDECEGALK